MDKQGQGVSSDRWSHLVPDIPTPAARDSHRTGKGMR